MLDEWATRRQGHRGGLETIRRELAAKAPHRPPRKGGLALMLASEKAGGITGQAINVDGGAVMV